MDGLLPDDDDPEGHGLMRVGSLFSGYGGLDMAVGGEVAWYSDIEPAACTVLEAHYPNVPNIGDIKLVDWNNVEPVDILTGGYPCQPFSQAGKRLGEKDDRHLWPYVKQAISILRPGLVILENVRGHLTLGFNTVLGEIAELGYDAQWGIVRASDAGAPHQRARLFIVAHPKGGEWGPKKSKYIQAERATEPRECFGTVADANREPVRREHRSRNVDREINSNYGKWWPIQNSVNTIGATIQNDKNPDDRFGPFANAIRRWEQIIGRVPPEPIVKVKEKEKINPVFVEWMMGLPEGHVTNHGLTLSQELKMLGNGVVPQQAALALKLLGVAA